MIDATPPDTLITSRGEFQEALRRAFATLSTAACRDVWLCDEDFAHWPLGDIETIEHLSRWAAPGRRLVLLARTFDEVARRHPRWVRWRRDYSHLVTCRRNQECATGEFPCVFLAADTLTVRLSDLARFRGRMSPTAIERVSCKEILDAISQRSEEAFPATTTGL
ncbi:MAG: hypothetical protein M3O01_10060 [Pseudomonadota bacterium]|nr:hypothetical protein [Pseudomonadota bacterium]